MPKLNSLEKILARARLDAKRAVNPVKQSKAKALTDNPDWQAQYLAEFTRFYADKISTQNETDRKNDSIKKQILTARNAKSAAAYSANNGYVISDDDIKNEAQKYGEDAEIYIRNYKDEYQKVWGLKPPAEQIQSKAKTNGARAARQGYSISEEHLVQSAKQCGELAELYIQTYKDSYYGLFDNIPPEQKVKVKAKKNGRYAARQNNSIDEEQLVQSAEQYGELAELYIQTYKATYNATFDNMTPEQKVKARAKTNGAKAASQANSIDEDHLAQSAKQYGELAELYIQTYKDAYHAIFDNMTMEQKVKARAKMNGAQAARQANLIDEEHLAQSAKQCDELAELYIQTYKDAYHAIFDNMTPEQKVKARAKMNGAQAARKANLINEEHLMKSAKQYDELAELYIQTYKDAYRLVSDHMTSEEKVIAKAKNNGSHLAYNGYDSIDEKRLATTAAQYGEFAEIYVENYKNSHKTFINKKRPLPENAKKPTDNPKRRKLS